ncbi:MAG TPA: alpha/beta hydrolase [Ohtaekwangia sp.]|nr:alpha/beta hydrolase [Ohtaekwangia sp.]
MQVLKVLAIIVIILYCVAIALLYFFQTRLIFFPGKLVSDYKFRLGLTGSEVFLTTKDGASINGIFYGGTRSEVILYFHGNAGDLSGWQFVAEDFTEHGYNILIIDYRGYGKSSGEISEDGFYRDADAAYDFLVREKDFNPRDIIVYGRSVGTGVAVDVASRLPLKGLVLESPYSSLGKLANEKLPFMFPSLYLSSSFDNLRKIASIRCPVIIIHGEKDTLVPVAHGKVLFDKIKSRKKMVLIPQGSHNDLNAFPEYDEFLRKVLPQFF